jgi:hypothetical protein
VRLRPGRAARLQRDGALQEWIRPLWRSACGGAHDDLSYYQPIEHSQAKAEGTALTILQRAWVPLVVVVALIIGGVAVFRLNGVFPGPGLSKPDPRDATPPYAAKTAIYEILGPPGTTGVATTEGQLHHVAVVEDDRRRDARHLRLRRRPR